MENMTLPGKKESKRSIRYLKKHSHKVDMTPMVDLGFLLITFFVFTSEINKPMSTDLFMPADGAPSKLAESNALTILLASSNRIYYYHGNWDQAVQKNEIHETGYSFSRGVGKIIRDKQKILEVSNGKDGRNTMMMLIKADAKATYENLVDILDEVMINGVKKYAIVKLIPGEVDYMALSGRSN